MSLDLQNYAQDVRLPSLTDLGICDLSSNALKASDVWDLYRQDLILNDDGDTVHLVETSLIEHLAFMGDNFKTHVFSYAPFIGADNGLWLQDVDDTSNLFPYPSRYYVDNSGGLHVCPVSFPSKSNLFGDFCPVFTISPQN